MGQDAINEMIENLPKTPEKVVEGVKGKANVLEGVKEGYSNLRDKLGFESPACLHQVPLLPPCHRLTRQQLMLHLLQ